MTITVLGMTHTEITQLAQQNATNYANELWRTNPAGHDEAAEWCAAALVHDLDKYGLPDNGINAIPAALTEQWTWKQIDNYEITFVRTFQRRITQLCRELLNNQQTNNQ